MTLVQLRHFIALAKTGSFSRAAEALFVTQPALSRSIQALEAEFGQPLFDRVGRRSELTPFGRERLGRAEQLVADADELAAAGGTKAAAPSGRLRLGLGSGPGAALMTALLEHGAGLHPRLQLSIARGHTELLVQSLRERQLDALVVDRHSLSPAPDLKVEMQREMRVAYLCRAGHPLLRRRKAPCFADLRAYPIASTPLSSEAAHIQVERYGPDAHPERCVALRCDEISSLIEVVRRSDAVLLAVRALAPDLKELVLNPPLDARARYGLVTLARRTEAPALQIVRDLIEQRLRD